MQMEKNRLSEPRIEQNNVTGKKRNMDIFRAVHSHGLCEPISRPQRR